LSIELLCAAQAKDYHRPLKSTAALEAVHDRVRQSIPHIEMDQPMEELMDEALKLVKSLELIELYHQYGSEDIDRDLKQQFDLF